MNTATLFLEVQMKKAMQKNDGRSRRPEKQNFGEVFRIMVFKLSFVYH
jgi:hypothetical protein